MPYPSCKVLATFASLFLGFQMVQGTPAVTNASRSSGFEEMATSPWAADEEIITITNFPRVRIVINAPAKRALDPKSNLTLVFFGTPNGSSVENTAGKKIGPTEDWHYNIQHIAAQTRFLRQLLTNETIVVAYLENGLKAWPTWRKQNGDQLIPEFIQEVRKRFPVGHQKIILTGHSGGGSLTFGYLNQLKEIPDDIARIAFLDSNYAYDTALHRGKLLRWLQASKQHYLCVLAYHDHIALLDGKPFVSEAGGTWGRTRLMKKDFEEVLSFTSEITPEFQKYFALDRRVQLLMKENPDRKILHTVQVEKNGFIHAILAGTENENRGYTYYGDRAYSDLIEPK